MKKKYQKKLKTILDFLFSVIVIIILSPLYLIISILIKVDSPGPVLFKQQRLGKDGKVFLIYKFRTMVVGAEKFGDGLRVKSDSDYRITMIGRFLRKTSIDETPQAINVLKGEMSFIGPRPPSTFHPYKYSEYPLHFKKRFVMKPGITGLSQVAVRNSVPWDKRLVYDITYIDEYSIWLDLKILFLTVVKILNMKNLYKENF